jgi:hypothetical protein
MPSFLLSPRFLSGVRIVTAILLTVCVVYAIVLAFEGRFSRARDIQVQTDEDVRVTSQAVSRLMDTPPEVPTVATVTDVAKLGAQAFFVGAVSGDKVLFYNDAKKVILYRPSTDKIIKVGPLTFR